MTEPSGQPAGGKQEDGAQAGQHDLGFPRNVLQFVVVAFKHQAEGQTEPAEYISIRFMQQTTAHIDQQNRKQNCPQKAPIKSAGIFPPKEEAPGQITGNY